MSDHTGTWSKYRLSCSHVRRIKDKEKPMKNNKKYYCLECDNHFLVVERPSRW